MRVLHINSYYSNAGKPTFYRNFFDAQVKAGLDIDVFVPVDREINPLSKEQFGEYSQVVKTHNPFDRYIYHLKQGKILKEAISRYSREKFDIIHSHSLFTNGYVAWKLSEKLGVPYIVALRNTDLNTFFRFMPHLRGTGIRIMRNAAGLIFLSRPYLDRVVSRYVPEVDRDGMVKRSRIIFNGIDDFWINRLNSHGKEYSNGCLRLLTVGQVNRNKNQVTAAKAAEILIHKGFKVTLTVVGEKKDERVFRKLQEYPFVRYLPPVTKEKLIDIYREADIFVLPSITETFGLVYPEAMSQGLTIIYSRGQGFDGHFEEGRVGSRGKQECRRDSRPDRRYYKKLRNHIQKLC